MFCLRGPHLLLCPCAMQWVLWWLSACSLALRTHNSLSPMSSPERWCLWLAQPRSKRPTLLLSPLLRVSSWCRATFFVPTNKRMCMCVWPTEGCWFYVRSRICGLTTGATTHSGQSFPKSSTHCIQVLRVMFLAVAPRPPKTSFASTPHWRPLVFAGLISPFSQVQI